MNKRTLYIIIGAIVMLLLIILLFYAGQEETATRIASESNWHQSVIGAGQYVS